MKKHILSILMLFTIYSPLYSVESKFLLLLGPSGVGKSTIIRHLQEMDKRFVYVSPYTTRKLREGEIDKIHVDIEQIQMMEKQGQLLCVNEIYGIFYATPKQTIDIAFKEGNFPILDWPISKLDIMKKNYGDKIFVVYVAVDDLKELERRLTLDGRDKDGSRLKLGVEEFSKYKNGEFDSLVDYKTSNNFEQGREVAGEIYKRFLSNLSETEKRRS